MNSKIQILKSKIMDFLDDTENSTEPQYDPVHIGMAIMIVLLSMGILFWLLWTLLVYEGGLFPKIVPGLRVLFTKKTAHDFGYEGYPYEMGVFEGWIGNVMALVFLIFVLACIAWLFQTTRRREE